jgi:hypothetical protein
LRRILKARQPVFDGIKALFRGTGGLPRIVFQSLDNAGKAAKFLLDQVKPRHVAGRAGTGRDAQASDFGFQLSQPLHQIADLKPLLGLSGQRQAGSGAKGKGEARERAVCDHGLCEASMLLS